MKLKHKEIEIEIRDGYDCKRRYFWFKLPNGKEHAFDSLCELENNYKEIIDNYIILMNYPCYKRSNLNPSTVVLFTAPKKGTCVKSNSSTILRHYSSNFEEDLIYTEEPEWFKIGDLVKATVNTIFHCENSIFTIHTQYQADMINRDWHKYELVKKFDHNRKVAILRTYINNVLFEIGDLINYNGNVGIVTHVFPCYCEIRVCDDFGNVSEIKTIDNSNLKHWE